MFLLAKTIFQNFHPPCFPKDRNFLKISFSVLESYKFPYRILMARILIHDKPNEYTLNCHYTYTSAFWQIQAKKIVRMCYEK